MKKPYLASAAQVTQALSALALSRASDPKMSTVTQFLQDPDWLSVDGGSASRDARAGSPKSWDLPGRRIYYVANRR